MRQLAVFSTKSYDKQYLSTTLQEQYPTLCEIVYHSFPLCDETASLAHGSDAVCAFVNDKLDAAVLRALHAGGTRAILLRCAGFNGIDLDTAEKLGLFVANVPSYSPEAVAEFAVALIQTLNRKTHRSYNRVREGNFNIEGLLGYTLAGKTVGVVGLGRIGLSFTRIMHGFGCKLLAYDPYCAASTDANGGGAEFRQLDGSFVELDELLREADIVSLHCPLTETTRHVIGRESLKQVKAGAMIVNTSRGALIDTQAAIDALKTGRLGGLALDVYEEEGALFYDDHSGDIIHDDALMRLMTFPNVLVCGHQAFFTDEALREIATVTLGNLEDFVLRRTCRNSLVREGHLLVEKDKEPVRL